MAKTYEVELGGRSRPLRYTREERREIEARFNTDMRSFLYESCFPLAADGKPTMGGRLECQEALLFYGLRHNGPKITEAWVAEHLQKLVAEGGSIYKPLSQAIIAVVASGLLGWMPQIKDDVPEEAEEGKAEAVTT